MTLEQRGRQPSHRNSQRQIGRRLSSQLPHLLLELSAEVVDLLQPAALLFGTGQFQGKFVQNLEYLVGHRGRITRAARQSGYGGLPLSPPFGQPALGRSLFTDAFLTSLAASLQVAGQLAALTGRILQPVQRLLSNVNESHERRIVPGLGRSRAGDGGRQPQFLPANRLEQRLLPVTQFADFAYPIQNRGVLAEPGPHFAR